MQNWVKASRIFLAIMFIFSAVSKMLSLPFFDGLVAELILGPDYYNNPEPLLYTQMLTRFLIGAELILGVAILLEFQIKRLVIPGILAMLLIFTIHLFYVGFTSSKGFIEGNCGCFGDILPMNNLESIIKNVVAIIAGVFVWMKYNPSEQKAFPVWTTPLVLGLITFATLGATIKDYGTPIEMPTEPEFEEEISSDTNNSSGIDTIQNAISEEGKIDDKTEKSDPKYPDKTTETSTSTKTDNSTPVNKTIQMLNKIPALSDGSKLNASSGKVLVCMFSMTCSHCQEIYRDMCKTNGDAGWPKTVLINFGKDFEQKYFFTQAGGCEKPHYRTEDYVQFNKWLEGEGFPRILAIENGVIKKSWNLDSYTKEDFFNFYGIKEKKTEDGGIKLQKPNNDGDGLQGKNPWD
ncbi:MAG: hypothetical protein GC181_09555 [Bacteroidetes bacterium]|nr:hypothetical protein [Bacteroidota bacterium]